MLKNSAIGISFFGIVMLFVLMLSRSYISFAAIGAALLHELAHVSVARMLGTKLTKLKLGIFGASLSMDSTSTSYKNEILICLAGPMANLLSAAILVSFLKSSSEFTDMFLYASLFLGLLNLLPISDFDGGRILFCTVAEYGSPSLASRVLKTASFLLLFLLWTLSVYLILRLGASLSLFVFCASVFCKIFVKDGI